MTKRAAGALVKVIATHGLLAWREEDAYGEWLVKVEGGYDEEFYGRRQWEQSYAWLTKKGAKR